MCVKGKRVDGSVSKLQFCSSSLSEALSALGVGMPTILAKSEVKVSIMILGQRQKTSPLYAKLAKMHSP